MNVGQLIRLLEGLPATTEVVIQGEDLGGDGGPLWPANAAVTSALKGTTEGSVAYVHDRGEKGDLDEDRRRRVVVIR